MVILYATCVRYGPAGYHDTGEVVLGDVELSKSMVNTGAATKRYVIETSDFVAPLNPGIPTTLIHSDFVLANDTIPRLDMPMNVAAQEGASRRVSCHRRLLRAAVQPPWSGLPHRFRVGRSKRA
jgi:hypothetical protein